MSRAFANPSSESLETPEGQHRAFPWASVREFQVELILESMERTMDAAMHQVADAFADLGRVLKLPSPLQYHLLARDGRLVPAALLGTAAESYERRAAEAALSSLKETWRTRRPVLLEMAEAALKTLAPARVGGRQPRKPSRFDRWPFLRYDLLRIVDDRLEWRLGGGRDAPGLGADGRRAREVVMGSRRWLAVPDLTGDVHADDQALRTTRGRIDAELAAIGRRRRQVGGADPLVTYRRYGEWLYLHWARDMTADAIAAQYGLQTHDPMIETPVNRGAQVRRGVRRAQDLLDAALVGSGGQ